MAKKLEGSLQASCVEYFDKAYPQYTKFIPVKKTVKGKIIYKLQRISLLCANANGGTRHYLEAISMGRQGISVGYADLTLYVQRQAKWGLLLEIKIKPNKQTETQIEWQKMVQSQGYLYQVIYSFDDFKNCIDNYLK
jgi:hypothetical protein